MSNVRLVREAPLAHLRWDGGGHTVVLLHGVGGGREAWGDSISGTGSALAEAGFTAIAVDLPGYGHSPSIEPYDMAGLAAAVSALIQSLQLDRCALVGHSMGGMVAQEMMARSPGLVQALVLSATSPAFGRPDGAWQAEFLAQRLAPLDAGGGMAALAPGLALGMASPSAPHDAVARAAVLMSAVPEATYRRALQAIVGFDRRELLGDLRLPVLCLAGEHDRNAPPRGMQQMAARIAGAEYQCLAGVGHLANMEAPGPFNHAMVDFLQRRF
ncbi:MAG: alpha/beta hydrolase [Pseudomonadota bacterium]